MSKIVIMGCGAAPGVPSIANGWGCCNPDNPKNRRRRSGAYIECGNAKFLIDTSPDIHDQILDNNIRYIDAILYTHAHADHLHGIDDIRDLNRITAQSINVYANAQTIATIENRFAYVLSDKNNPHNPLFLPSLIANEVEMGKEFEVSGVKIVPLPLEGHAIASNGYIINDGEIVYVADCLKISQEGLQLITKRPKVLIMPLTTIVSQHYHMGLDRLLEYVDIIRPYKTIINHMAVECDYDNVNQLTPADVSPAYDNMIIEI